MPHKLPLPTHASFRDTRNDIVSALRGALLDMDDLIAQGEVLGVHPGHDLAAYRQQLIDLAHDIAQIETKSRGR